MFVHDCANAILELQKIKGPSSFCFNFFFHKFFSIILQRMETSSILSRVITVSLVTSWLSPIQNAPPITTADLLQAIGCWDKEILRSSLC
jgi:hypothetical protein